ncbi:MAG: PG0541 family transporter-associated protein [Deltaproteobacteria bacterium]
MKMLMVVYSGANPHRVTSLLDRYHAGGYTEFHNAHGAGSTGRRDGSRAWPGESTLVVSVVPAEQADALVETLRAETTQLPAGERLHVAVLPTDIFF